LYGIAGRLKLGFAVDQRDILTVYGELNSQYFSVICLDL